MSIQQGFVDIYDYDKDWVWSFPKQRSFNLKRLTPTPTSATGDFSWMTQGRIFPSTFDELIEYMGGENYVDKWSETYQTARSQTREDLSSWYRRYLRRDGRKKFYNHTDEEYHRIVDTIFKTCALLQYKFKANLDDYTVTESGATESVSSMVKKNHAIARDALLRARGFEPEKI